MIALSLTFLWSIGESSTKLQLVNKTEEGLALQIPTTDNYQEVIAQHWTAYAVTIFGVSVEHSHTDQPFVVLSSVPCALAMELL